MGVGRKLFNHMLDVFRDAGMNEYFLFTDTTCDYGFYDYRGLTRKAECTIRRGFLYSRWFGRRFAFLLPVRGALLNVSALYGK